MTRKRTRKEILSQCLQLAEANGFPFQRWFQTHIRPLWVNSEEAIDVLLDEGRYFSLVYSQEFARAFWKKGIRIRFMAPPVTYSRVDSEGNVVGVTRESFARRAIQPEVWKLHLRHMAMAYEPLRYLQRFLPAAVEGTARKPISRRSADAFTVLPIHLAEYEADL